MNVAIGVGRTIVENEFLASVRGLAQPAVKAHLLPARENLGLALRQIPPHREAGSG